MDFEKEINTIKRRMAATRCFRHENVLFESAVCGYIYDYIGRDKNKIQSVIELDDLTEVCEYVNKKLADNDIKIDGYIGSVWCIRGIPCELNYMSLEWNGRINKEPAISVMYIDYRLKV